MILERKKIFLRGIRYILEDIPDTDMLKKKYQMITILTYDNIKLNGFTVRKKKTPLVDLSRIEAEIFNSFHDTTRNEIRRTEKIAGMEFVSDDKNIDEAYNLYRMHEQAQGRKPEKREEFIGTKIFSAYYKNEMISTVICFDSPKILRAKAISSKRLEHDDKEIRKIISFSSRRIMWEICKYGKKHGYSGFDLGSINLSDPKKESIARFKMTFGGGIVDEYLYIYKSRFFEVFEKAVKIRNKLYAR